MGFEDGEKLSPSSASRPHAVVAGIGLNGLGVIRSLAKARIPTVAVDVDLEKPTAATRLAQKFRVPALAGSEFVAALLELRRKFDEDPVLILTDEQSVLTVSEARRELQAAYRIALPGHDRVRDLLDKSAFQALAEKFGLRLPRAITLASPLDAKVVEALRYPCVLKPAVKDDAYSARFAKAYRVETPGETLKLVSAMHEVCSAIILQEWIVGEDDDVYFCLQYRDRNGVAAASFVGRKVLQWPPLVGGTASCIPAPEVADELVSMTDSFFAATGVSGFCSMEFKRDRRDLAFYAVEPTIARTDYQEEIATLNGVNVPAVGYACELGRPMEPGAPAAKPVGWKDGMGVANANAAGATASDRVGRARLRYYDALFRADDPGPYLRSQVERVRSRLSRTKR